MSTIVIVDHKYKAELSGEPYLPAIEAVYDARIVHIELKHLTDGSTTVLHLESNRREEREL